MSDHRTIRVAAVTGSLAWAYRQTCSREAFDPGVAARYVREYTGANLARMERAAADGARIVVGPEYFRGSEMFTTTPENHHALVEPPDGATSRRMGAISRAHGAALCCSYEADHGGHVVQTGILTDVEGRLAAVHAKHPRRIPPPDGWPFGTAARVFETGVATVGITVCSDCTYDPGLPLAMGRLGMEVLLIPGCGFIGKMWRSFVIVRARDTQSIVIYADDNRAAIVDSTGEIRAETDTADTIIAAEVELRPKKCSPDFQG